MQLPCRRKSEYNCSFVSIQGFKRLPFEVQLTLGRRRVEYKCPVPAAACELIETLGTCKGAEFCCAPWTFLLPCLVSTDLSRNVYLLTRADRQQNWHIFSLFVRLKIEWKTSNPSSSRHYPYLRIERADIFCLCPWRGPRACANRSHKDCHDYVIWDTFYESSNLGRLIADRKIRQILDSTVDNFLLIGFVLANG